MNKSVAAKLSLLRENFALHAEFSVPGDGITAFFGPSGAGKTTLLRALAGLEPCSGRVEVTGEVWQDGSKSLAPYERGVGFVFQESSLFPHLDVKGNLDYGFSRAPADKRLLEFEEAVDLFGLRPLLGRKAQQLSGGERKRVAIARALLNSPRMLLLDEPMASLDTQHKNELLPYLEGLRDSLTIPILFVSHMPDEVARLADHLVLMDKGKVLGSGAVNEVLTRFDLPIAHETDAGAIVTTQLLNYDAKYNLSELGFAGGKLFVPGKIESGLGEPRVRVLARDVSLTLEQQTATSILNIVPATVTDLTSDEAASSLIKLDANGTILLARVTRRSVASLQLKPGRKVYAQIKTAALLGPKLRQTL